jgi:Ca-activated chloride channel family protein
MRARLIWPVVALALAAPLAARQDQQVFRTGVETVAIYATVVDQSNLVVRNLKREDFRVFDNGALQELTNFEDTFQPISAIVLVDTSASMTLMLDLAREAAEQFVIRLSPGDRVRVGSVSDSVTLSPEFTDDRDSLLKSLRDDLHIGNPTRLWDGVDETLTELRGLGGRRVAVLITDGEDTISETTGKAVVERARAEGVVVYVAQIRGRTRPGIEAMIAGPSRPGLSTLERVPVPPARIMRDLAEDTGGAFFTLGQRDDVGATFTQVAFELHYQYVLGFTPQKLDGKLHEIEVKTRDPKWTVRSRRYYLAKAQ